MRNGDAHDHGERVTGDDGGQERDDHGSNDVLETLVVGGHLRKRGNQQTARQSAQHLGGDVHQRRGVQHGQLADQAHQQADHHGLIHFRAREDDCQAVHSDHEIGLHARKAEEAGNGQLKDGAGCDKHGHQDKILYGQALLLRGGCHRTLLGCNVLSHDPHSFLGGVSAGHCPSPGFQSAGNERE